MAVPVGVNPAPIMRSVARPGVHSGPGKGLSKQAMRSFLEREKWRSASASGNLETG